MRLTNTGFVGSDWTLGVLQSASGHAAQVGDEVTQRGKRNGAQGVAVRWVTLTHHWVMAEASGGTLAAFLLGEDTDLMLPHWTHSKGGCICYLWWSLLLCGKWLLAKKRNAMTETFCRRTLSYLSSDITWGTKLNSTTSIWVNTTANSFLRH